MLAKEKTLITKKYYPVKFRWKVVQQLEVELLTEQRACEKYGITVNLIRLWRRQYHQRRLLPLIKPTPMKPKQSKAEQIKALEEQLRKPKKPSRKRSLKIAPMKL